MTLTSHIRHVAVLGAGTMGAQIAAHLANAGLPVLLLDITPETARDSLKKALALRPDPLFTKQAAALIRTGGFFDDLKRVADSDWIIEVVVEQLEVKRTLLKQLDGLRAPHTIDRKSTRLNSSHSQQSRMPSSA